MGQTENRCAFCMAPELEPTTITIEREIGPVKVTVEGVPATHCLSCSQTGVSGKVAFPVDEAMTSIFYATGATVPPTPEEIAAIQAENRALSRALGLQHSLADDPAEEPSGATTRA